MKRDLSQELLTLKGEPFDPPATLEAVAFNALTQVHADDQAMGVDVKLKHYALARKVARGGIQDFTAEELADIKARIGKLYVTQVVGAAFEALDRDYQP
jgi:hypothetical protein